MAFTKTFNVARPAVMNLKSFQLHGALTDCTSGALGFFQGVRVPSTLVAGSALSTAFLYADSPPAEEGRLGLYARYAQSGFAILSFCLSIVSVVITTTTSTTLMLGKYDPMATDVYHFLKRELNFEFVLTRWSFLTSLISFLISVCTRILIEFRFLNPQKRKLGVVLTLLMTSFISICFAHINHTLNCWGNLGLMTLEVLRMMWFVVSDSSRPTAMFAFASFVGSAVVGASMLLKDPISKNKTQ